MKLAIMQPYFIPYLGYFQMMNAVDKFIVYDDVNFTKRGWIQRNKITIGGKEQWIGLSLSKASQLNKINEVSLNHERKWRQAMLEKLRHRYNKSPNYSTLRPMIESWTDRNYTMLSELLYQQLTDIRDYLNIDTELVLSSKITNNQRLKRSERILDTCLQLGADTYINAIGGQKLYDKSEFSKAGVNLHFIQMKNPSYESILDWMMEKDVSEIQTALNEYELL